MIIISTILGIIGFITISVIVIRVLYRLYRRYVGYTWNSCPNDHDTMARHGQSRCHKCNNDL